MFWLFIAIGFVVVYLFLGWSVQRFLPPQTPHLQQYFTPGMRFASKLEGMEHTIVRVTETHVHTLTTLRPHAQGPPVHVHMLMDESFQVVSGELSLEIGGTIKSYTAGETIFIPKATPHRPFNASAQDVVISTSPQGFPLEFAFSLSQLYGFWDSDTKNQQPPRILWALAAQHPFFDSYPTQLGPTPAVQRVMRWVMAPMARLLGYHRYQHQFAPTLQA